MGSVTREIMDTKIVAIVGLQSRFLGVRRISHDKFPKVDDLEVPGVVPDQCYNIHCLLSGSLPLSTTV